MQTYSGLFFFLVALWLSLPPELIALQSVGTTEGKKGATTFCRAWLPKLMPWSRLYGQAWLVLALIPIPGAGMSKYLQVGGGQVHTLTCSEQGECVVFRAHFQKTKKKAANFYFRSDLGTKILNFTPVSETIAPKVACTPGDQTSFKFSLLVMNSVLLLFEYKAGSAVERLSFKIPSPWVTALSILPAYMGFVTSVTTPGPGSSQMRIRRKEGTILLQGPSLPKPQRKWQGHNLF